MTRWDRVEEVYHRASELEPDQCAEFLDEACAGDEHLRREVESLLAYTTRAGEFIETPAIEVAADLLARDQARSMLGRKIGPYEIRSLLAIGGMGEVYLANDTRLGRKTALKFLHLEAIEDIDRLRRFEQEARTASALNHPNIITIYDIGVVDGIQYIATEFIEGETLRQRITGGRLDLRSALDIACQVASALGAAHDVGIVHRDIKPENIMLRRDGYVKVLDFGLAKLAKPQATKILSASPQTSTEAGVVLGTVNYMSPEQARGYSVDARTDIFSFGVVLYEMISGSSPFAGATSADVIASILERDPPALQRSEAPEPLERIITKSLRKDLEERYRTAKELLSDLTGLKRRLEFEEEMGSPAPAVTVSGSLPRQSLANQPDVIDSLAVLPLANTSADPEMEYFSDGITESIINALSRLQELRVMAWSTVCNFKGRQIEAREIGKSLNVRAVLTGRLIQLADRLVIKAELADTRDGSHLWGEQYSCSPSDILDVEADIAREISEKLLVRLTTEERRRLAKRYTEQSAAYHDYLKGRHFWNKRTDESVRQGIEFFNRAIDADPGYALAYAGLADSYVILGSFGIATLSSGEAYPRAKAAATRALGIDDSLAEAHASLAMSLASYDWDWPSAKSEFKRSLDLNSDYATAHHWYGFTYLAAKGRLSEAIASVERAHDLAPLSIGISSDLGLLYYLARDYDKAIDHYREGLEIDPNFTYSHWKLGLAYVEKGMFEEAISELRTAIDLSGRSTLAQELLGYAFAVAGRNDEARAVLNELIESAKVKNVSAYRIAAIYAALGQKEDAFDWLEQAYQRRDPWMIWLNLNPVLDSIRPDKRFRSLLRRIGIDGDSDAAANRVSSAGARSAQPRRKTSRKTINSLAILPFINTSDDPSMEYLSDGITESIINTLSQLPKLRVVARSTVFRYKGRDIDPHQAGRELNVQAVLTGTVRQIADRLIISAEFLDVATDSHVWGERFNRNLSDIFAIQEEIAKEITLKLQLKLSRRDKGRLSKRRTHNVEAYQCYLKGRYHWNKRSTESLNKGVEYFKQAIDLDPTYTSAYAGLSDSYTLLVVREASAPEEGFAKAKAAAAMALEIDKEFAEAYASLGHAMLHNWEWEDGEKELKRAIELNPGYASAHHWYSEHLTAMGRCDESITELKNAAALDPLSLVISADLGRAFYYAREYDQVFKQEARTLEMDSHFWLSYINLGRARTQEGKHDEAIEMLNKARELSGDNTEVLSFLGFAYAAAERRDEALNTLRDLEERSNRDYVPPYHLAIVHAGLGDSDRAFELLEEAFERHSVDLFTLKVEPMFDGLRSDSRFDDLLRRVGLTPPKPDPKPAKSGGESVIPGAIAHAQLAAMAVLPFRPIGADGRDQILELGIADALITKLSDINQIVVRPISSVRRYTDLEQDFAAAGRELAVQSVLEGSIQRLGDRIRITARLLKVDDGRSLWTGKFDEQFTDIFAVQDSISEKVAAALALKLTGDQRERLTKRQTESAEAYQLYLKGRFYWNKRSEESLNKSIECFEQAIEIDPNYAAAYVGIADCYTKLGDVGVAAITSRDAFARARTAAFRALEIDESLAEVHASLGHLDMHHLRWSDAESDFKRAIGLNPNYATAHQWYAYYMAFHRRFDEALEMIEVAGRLDPLSLPIADSVGEFLYFGRRNEEAVEQFRKVLEMDPDFLASRINLGRAFEQMGMFGDAEGEFLAARRIAAESMEALASLAHTFAVSGKKTAASEVLAQLTELAKERYVSPYVMAVIHTGLAEVDEAFRWLEEAYDKSAEWVIYTNVDPRLDPLRSDARFTALLARLGFKR